MAWLTVFHGDEQYFWKRLTPRRMDLLLTEYSGRNRVPKQEQRSLSDYLAGGG